MARAVGVLGAASWRTSSRSCRRGRSLTASPPSPTSRATRSSRRRSLLRSLPALDVMPRRLSTWRRGSSRRRCGAIPGSAASTPRGAVASPRRRRPTREQQGVQRRRARRVQALSTPRVRHEVPPQGDHGARRPRPPATSKSAPTATASARGTSRSTRAIRGRSCAPCGPSRSSMRPPTKARASTAATRSTPSARCARSSTSRSRRPRPRPSRGSPRGCTLRACIPTAHPLPSREGGPDRCGPRGLRGPRPARPRARRGVAGRVRNRPGAVDCL